MNFFIIYLLTYNFSINVISYSLFICSLSFDQLNDTVSIKCRKCKNTVDPVYSERVGAAKSVH